MCLLELRSELVKKPCIPWPWNQTIFWESVIKGGVWKIIDKGKLQITTWLLVTNMKGALYGDLVLDMDDENATGSEISRLLIGNLWPCFFTPVC